MFTLMLGDCLEKLNGIKDGSIDMVMCDPPYGVSGCRWDCLIDFEGMWNEINRVCKTNAAIVFTAIQPFTSSLIFSNKKQFKYCWVWKKNIGSGFLNAKFMPMRYHEDVVVFYREKPTYNPIRQKRSRVVHKIYYGDWREDSYHKSVGKMKHNPEKHDKHMKSPETVVNINSVKNFYGKYHPTQKPVPLMEYFIKTYTNEGDTVLDFAMGSGTTGVACKYLKRGFVGVELDYTYFGIAVNRIINE